MAGDRSECVCAVPEPAGDGARLVLATRLPHTIGVLRAVGARCRADVQVLGAGMVEVTGDDLDVFLAETAASLSSVEADEVRCLRTDDRSSGLELLSEALVAPSLRAAGARVQHADLLPLFEDERSRFHCDYQPIVELSSRRTRGYEALLRATDLDGSRVLPDQLFPAAEAAGWTHVLDRVGRSTALRDAGSWLAEDELFINVAPSSIYRADVCMRTTEQAADEAGIPLDQLVFEVTEGDRVRDVEHLARVFGYYRSKGCRVALDDLGAGWASLNLLVGLQPDVVKLDREIVQALPATTAAAVVAAIVDIAHSYGGTVLAECIETENQASCALDLGVDLGQGWLFGAPATPVRARRANAVLAARDAGPGSRRPITTVGQLSDVAAAELATREPQTAP